MRRSTLSGLRYSTDTHTNDSTYTICSINSYFCPFLSSSPLLSFTLSCRNREPLPYSLSLGHDESARPLQLAGDTADYSAGHPDGLLAEATLNPLSTINKSGIFELHCAIFFTVYAEFTGIEMCRAWFEVPPFSYRRWVVHVHSPVSLQGNAYTFLHSKVDIWVIDHDTTEGAHTANID